MEKERELVAKCDSEKSTGGQGNRCTEKKSGESCIEGQNFKERNTS